MKTDSILFDLDGTLWNSSSVVLKSWNAVLSQSNLNRKSVTAEEMDGTFGLQLPEIGEMLFASDDREERMKVMQECCNYEVNVILKEGGVLYPGLEETLKALSEKVPLFIISNCQNGYIEAFLKYHRLGQYFKDCECAERTGKTKGENINLVAKRNGLKNPVYVGDTLADWESAHFAGIPFIFASYGFGNVTTFDASVNKIEDLVGIIEAE